VSRVSVPGSRMNASVAECAYGIRAAILTGQTGERPGRENSLASLSAFLTNSLSHTRDKCHPAGRPEW